MPQTDPWSPPTGPRMVYLDAAHHDALQGSSLRLVASPASARQVATGLSILLPLLLLALLFVPWQQTALGAGKVIALTPADRSQSVEAPVKGTLAEWRVMEGQSVQEGDILAILSDNDPEYLERLTAERAQVDLILAAVTEQIQTYRMKVGAETTARDLAVAEYDTKVLAERQKLAAEEAALTTARIQLERIATLAAEGIESTRKLELAQLDLAKADAAVQARRQSVAGAERARDKAAQAGDSKVASASADLQSALTKQAEAKSKQLAIDVKLSRQERQVVRAPRAGRVLRLYGGPGSAQVKPGDTLVTLVPDSTEPAVELKIDGNDIPLITEGDTVSIVFEGWPALQFSGWPDLGAGTFRGTVAFMDATDDGTGQFRIVVTPEPDGDPWPPATRLRQGARAKGFVLLSRVSLGYELWRQINGFPPLPPKGEKDSSTGLPPTQKKPRASKVLK